MKSNFDLLKEYFNNTPKEVVLKEWEATKEFDMKTIEIKDLLNKDLLIIEIPYGFQGTECDENYYISTIEDDKNLKSFSKKYYTLLGKPDEIKESDAAELVKAFQFGTKKNPHLRFLDYKTDYFHCFFAKESLLSLIGSEIYWENPYGNKMTDFDTDRLHIYDYLEKKEKWHEAEQKTFERNRTLIFVKN